MPAVLLGGTWPRCCLARGAPRPPERDPGLGPGRPARALQWFKSTSKTGHAICISSEKWDATWKNNLFVPPGNIVCSLVVQTHQH